jgi:membrane dipeptidase
MLRKFRVMGVGLLALWTAGCAVITDSADRLQNAVATPPPYAIGADAARLYATLSVADMHSDAILSPRDLTVASGQGHLDISRLQDAHVRIQTFTQPTFSPLCLKGDGCTEFPNLIGLWAFASGWPPDTWFNQQKRALYYAGRLADLASRSEHRLVFVRNARELRAVLDGADRHAIAAVLGIEGDEALAGDARFVPKLAAAGYSIFGLVHQADNDAGGSSTGVSKGGITPFGAEVLAAADNSGMILDLAHASAQTIDDAAAYPLHRPPIVSHTGLTSICDTPRNIGDEQVRNIVKAGGLIGVGYWDVVLCMDGKDDAHAFAQKVSDTIMKVVSLTRSVKPQEAFDHVALGSDFEGWVHEGFDVSGLGLIAEALLRAGVSDADIAKVMGANYREFLLKYLPPSD